MRSGRFPSRSLSAISNKSWLRTGLSLILAVVAIFLLARNVNTGDVQTALSEADYTFIAIALLIFLFTLIIKVWRWYWMFRSDQIRPRISSLYRALVVGQFLNFIFPLRIGELARVYSLDLQSGIGKTKSLSTIIIEKTLDLVALFLSAALLIPFIVLPEFILDNGYRSITMEKCPLWLDHGVKAALGNDKNWPDGKYRNIRFTPVLRQTDKEKEFILELSCWLRTKQPDL